MKTLISLKDVEVALANGDTTLYIDENTIITPSARDAAAVGGLSFEEKSSCDCSVGQSGSDDDLIYRALQILLEKGMMGPILQAFGKDIPYVSESDSAGMLKLVRGESAQWLPLETNTADAKAFYNTLIDRADGAAMTAGFMRIDEGAFPWLTECQEIYYVVEGTLTIEKDGRIFKAHAGDGLFFKKGTHIALSVQEPVKVFYVTD